MKLSGITFATLALLPQIATLKCAEIAREGTMVVAFRFDDGFVICADKRSHLDGPNEPAGNYRDDDVKITIFNGSGGFVTAGVPILQRSDGVRVFDADRTISDFLNVHGFNELDKLPLSLEASFRRYVLSQSPNDRPPTQWNDEEPIFVRAMIFFQQGKEIKLYDLSLTYVNASPPQIEARIENRSQDRLRAYGALVLREILGGKDRRFSDLRSDPIFTSTMGTRWVWQVNEEKAVSFAKKVIQVTSERIHLLNPMLIPRFGPTSDCAVARTGKDVEWRPYSTP